MIFLRKPDHNGDDAEDLYEKIGGSWVLDNSFAILI